MLTYVINTSENKTFDSDLLFELAGYNKIRWMHCSLNEVEECAKEIYNKQNTLGVDVFRIAILIDFYCFDKIRKPYGDSGYRSDPGVDLCVYYPYIEAYLSDHLFDYLEKRGLHSQTCEIYYIQNEKNDRYNYLANAGDQICKIMYVDRNMADDYEEQVEKDSNRDNANVPEEEELIPEGGESRRKYSVFNLYCTPTVSLPFSVQDYPYNDGSPMTFDKFVKAFNMRRGENDRRMICHTYLTSYGGGSAIAAFDTLALSLYLIRMYEREEDRTKDLDFEIDHPDALILKEVLEKAWNKIRIAQNLAKESRCDYFSLDLNEKTPTGAEASPVIDEGKTLRDFRAKVKAGELDMPAEAVYRKITEYTSRNVGEFNEEDRREFDAIMSQYLQLRDDTREESVKNEFETLRKSGVLITVKQCPSKVQYDMAVEGRQQEISRLFDKALKAEYIKTDYSEEQKRSQKLYAEYLNLKSRMSKYWIADVVILVILLAAMLIPYHFLQPMEFFWLRYVIMVSICAGIYVVAFIFITLSISLRMKRLHSELQDCLRTCIGKHQIAFSGLKRRYTSDLFQIEQTRYEIRQLTKLQEFNMAQNKIVNQHRDTLEKVENRLSAILNNLGVEPVPDLHENVESEFNIQSPIRSFENKIYKVFSIETIETIFPRKGGNL